MLIQVPLSNPLYFHFCSDFIPRSLLVLGFYASFVTDPHPRGGDERQYPTLISPLTLLTKPLNSRYPIPHYADD